MAVKKNLQKGGLRMRQVVATALALLLKKRKTNN